MSNFRLWITAENWENLAAENSPACQQAGGASARSADWENLISSKKSQFVSYSIAPHSVCPQTFTIILPNLIHQLKKRNLSWRIASPPKAGWQKSASRIPPPTKNFCWGKIAFKQFWKFQKFFAVPSQSPPLADRKRHFLIYIALAPPNLCAHKSSLLILIYQYAIL